VNLPIGSLPGDPEVTTIAASVARSANLRSVDHRSPGVGASATSCSISPIGRIATAIERSRSVCARSPEAGGSLSNTTVMSLRVLLA